MSDTLLSMLERAARVPRHGVRLLDRHEEPSWLAWPEIAERAAAIAGRLAAGGVEPGDRVALVFPTGEEVLAALFGVLAAGAVPVPLAPAPRLGRLADYRQQTSRLIARCGARRTLADLASRRLLGGEGATTPRGLATLAELPEAAPLWRRSSPDRLALVQFSSGTTGEPRPVALTERAVCAQVKRLNGFWPAHGGGEESGVSWLPLYHDMGLVGCLFTALERPGTLTLFAPELFAARPATWLRAISRYRATLSAAPNFAYALCAERVRDEELLGVDLSCWRVALDGAEPISPSTLERFAARFAPWGFPRTALTPVYGLSEAALAVTFSDPAAPPRLRRFDRAALGRDLEARASADGMEIVSVGSPLPGFTLSIRGPEGAVLGEGRVGRIFVRGPSLMAGYLDDPAATAQAVLDGWLDTGDLGFLFRGELYLVGRAKDVLIVRGRNHPPEDVERAAAGVPGARVGGAVAVSHLGEGAAAERLVVFVEAARRISEAARQGLAAAARLAVLASTGLEPDEVVVLAAGALPRTSSGKLRRQEALRRYLEGELAVGGAW